ncbi:FAD dependent oxidoreductase protein [Rutstroemia sp. NJR-2017a WRK4]|nr:FAD dependent oxidoreductase protein [Rutstroemia sp. NJR-2017a WRK4]
MTSTASGPHPTSNPAKDHEPHPNPHALTHPDSNNGEVNYTPNPSASIKLSPEREKILKGITSLYSGSASEEDMGVYTENAIYDDPWSYCDNRRGSGMVSLIFFGGFGWGLRGVEGRVEVEEKNTRVLSWECRQEGYG